LRRTYNRTNNGPKPQPQGLSVEVRNNDINFALRKFKKKVQESGLLQELRERTHYVKPSEKRAKAKAAGVARWKKKQAKASELGNGPKLY
jgi:small subunit ribosomal protein S21